MGIYQLCYLKMHSGMLFLAGHTEDKEKETLLKALSDVMDAARKAMAGKSFARSPYRAPIAALAADAARLSGAGRTGKNARGNLDGFKRRRKIIVRNPAAAAAERT